MIGAEGGSRTRTTLRSTDFKSDSWVLTSFCYALPSSIYRRFSRQSKLRLAWYQHVTPLIFPSSLRASNPLTFPSSCQSVNSNSRLDSGANSRVYTCPVEEGGCGPDRVSHR